MPFAYLRKQRESEARQARLSGQPLPVVSSSGSPLGAIKVGLIAILVVPVLFNVPWLHSALGPGGLPDLWVRSVGVGDGGVQPDCVNLIGDGAGGGFRFCEDMHRIPGAERDTVIISCDANRAGWNTVMGPLGDAKPRGQLWTFEYPTDATSQLEDRVPVPVELFNFPEKQTFHPLGLSIFHQAGVVGGQLFVVNHREHLSSVELFHLYPTAREQGAGWVAQWQRSIVHPIATHTPNSIHALSESSFLVTNDHLFARRPGPLAEHMIPMLSQRFFNQPTSVLQVGGGGGSGGGGGGGVQGWVVSKLARVLSNPNAAAALAQIETLLGLSFGWVTMVQFNPHQGVETDGVKAKIVASNIPFANGIAVSPDNKTLIVAATTYPGVFIYDITPSKRPNPTGGETTNWLDLKLSTKLHLPFRVDNLAFTPHPLSSNYNDRFSNHALLATGHPAPLQLISMARNPLNQTSPSWTLSITPHTSSLASENTSPFETAFQQTQPWEDAEAPLPAHHFILSHNGAWSIRTLMQSIGTEVKDERKNRSVRLASSTSSFYHSHDQGGTLLVSGLYDGVLLCTNVGS